MSSKIISEYLDARDRGERVTAPRVKLTHAIIDGLPTKPYDYAIAEASVPGLSVRVRKDTGAKSFQVIKKVNGRMARGKVCAFGERPYTKGNESVIVAARAKIAEMDRGITPTKEKAKARAQAVQEEKSKLTVKDACNNYIAAKDRAKGTKKNYERFRDNHLVDWHHRQLASITEEDVEELFDEITEETGPVAANNVLRFFRSLWKHHRRKYGLGDSPTIIFTKDGDNIKSWNTEDRRERYVHRSELKPWWSAVERLRKEYSGDGDLAADYLQFALLTGLRRREITNINWEDINHRRKTLLIPENKSKRPFALPITKPMQSILDRRKGEARPFQIEEPRRFIDKVTEWSEVPFSTHDLRRSFLTHATNAHIPLPTQKALVNHSRENQDVTEGYIQIDEELMRDSLEKIQSYILAHAGQVKKVTPIKEASNA